MDHNAYLVPALVVGEPFLSRMQAYFEEYYRVMGIYSEFAKKYGAERMNVSGRLHGLQFVRKTGRPYGERYWPEGWTKPHRRTDMSTPMKANKELRAEMDALPKMPDPWAVYGDEIITTSQWATGKEPDENDYGSEVLIGMRINPRIEWTGEPDNKFYLEIPDIEKFLALQAIAHPERVYSKAMRDWQWPEGLQRVSSAEKDFEFAKRRLEREREDKAEEQAAA